MSSQTLLNDSTCCVPCTTLKKALLIKNERNYLKDQLGVARDSILIFNNMISNQKTIIEIQDKKIDLYKKNESSYKQLVSNKDQEIFLYKEKLKKQKKSKLVSYIVGGSCIVLSIIIAK